MFLNGFTQIAHSIAYKLHISSVNTDPRVAYSDPYIFNTMYNQITTHSFRRLERINRAAIYTRYFWLSKPIKALLYQFYLTLCGLALLAGSYWIMPEVLIGLTPLAIPAFAIMILQLAIRFSKLFALGAKKGSFLNFYSMYRYNLLKFSGIHTLAMEAIERKNKTSGWVTNIKNKLKDKKNRPVETQMREAYSKNRTAVSFYHITDRLIPELDPLKLMDDASNTIEVCSAFCEKNLTRLPRNVSHRPYRKHQRC